MALLSIKRSFEIPFIRFRFLPIILLVLMGLTTLFSWSVKGVNWGVDFQGGVVAEIQTLYPVDITQVRKNLKDHFKKEIAVQELGKKADTLLIRTENIEDTSQFGAELKRIMGEKIVIKKIESIGPKVGSELVKSSLMAILWALLGIMAYVWIRFEWQFSMCALFALLHDCLGLLSFFMIFQMEFNESAVVAILITAAYSINDTVVIFDRLRENMQAPVNKFVSFAKLLNLSLNETFARTLLTSSTALLALLMMYFFGGEVIASFSLPIIVGIVIGAYSSVVIAVPLLQFFPSHKNKINKS